MMADGVFKANADSYLANGRRSWILWGTTVLIILFGLCIRLYLLTERGLWLDEALCVKIAAIEGFVNMLRRVTHDIHPPLFYILLHSWIVQFGNTDYSVRLFSVIWGTMGLAGVFFLCRYGLNWSMKYSNLAVLLTAVLPLHVYYSQEVRPYGMWFALASFALGFLLRAHSQMGMRLYLTFGMIQALVLYVHHVAFVYCALLNVAYLAISLVYKQLNKRRLWGWIASGMVTFLVYSPWLPFFWKQLNNPTVFPGFPYWVGKPSLWSVGLIFVQVTGVWKLDLPFQLPRLLYVLAVLPIWLLLTFGTFYIFKQQLIKGTILAASLFAYPIGIFVLSQVVLPIWLLRIFLPAALGVPIIAVFGLKYAHTFASLKLISNVILILAVLLGSFSSLLWVHTYKKDDWKGAGEYLSSYVQEGDAVFVCRAANRVALERYVRPGTNIRGVGINWISREDFSDKLSKEVQRLGGQSKRIIIATFNSDIMPEKLIAGMQGTARLAERKTFYHVLILVFSMKN
ncbi:MAG: glycosyltransferase family 39 protein [Acidobacteriia bacterium]|nr:glycosyltransferase family 39 protein [Terriglobia bacterium]